VLVIGLGVLGLTSVAMARVAGAEVFAITNQSQPAAIASDLGARVFDRAGRAALVEALEAGADVVISTVNGWDDWQLALELAAQNGVIACLGFPGRGEELPGFNPLDSQLAGRRRRTTAEDFCVLTSATIYGGSPDWSRLDGCNRVA
jgi:D-arabinose 1-dehydrogenase-like Zn-dependent alcohol dehydrogenase